MIRQRLDVQNVVLDRARIGQTDVDLRILKPRPENARRIEEQKARIDRHPLLSARDAGAVFRLCALSSRDLVDKGGLPDIRDAHDHDLERSSDLSLFRVPPQLLGKQLPNRRDKAVDALAALTVRQEHRHAAAFEIFRPFFDHRRVCHVDPVEDDKARLCAADGVNIRVAAGNGDARVQDLTDRIDQLQVFLHHPACLGHVTGIPLDVHFLIA